MQRQSKLPHWLTKRLTVSKKMAGVHDVLKTQRLHTVCSEAQCPNRCECFARGTATFMILGAVCTRNCRFCAVQGEERPQPPDPDEPRRVAGAVKQLELKHVVVTSVTRDDLGDGGSLQFARTIAEIRAATGARVEVLTPDFQGRPGNIDRVVEARPDIFNHNVETVPRLYSRVRPEADYERSLSLIRRVAGAGLVAKSGLMLGLGEEEKEVVSVMEDLLLAGCRVLTLGQYLAPSGAHYAVREFIPPDRFGELGEKAREMGFQGVGSGPFVRSSYNADIMAQETMETMEKHSSVRTCKCGEQCDGL